MTCPSCTFSPSVTPTVATVPDVAKFKFACVTGSIVPLREVVCWTVPNAAGTVTYCGADVPNRERPAHAPAAATTRITAATVMSFDLVRAPRTLDQVELVNVVAPKRIDKPSRRCGAFAPAEQSLRHQARQYPSRSA